MQIGIWIRNGMHLKQICKLECHELEMPYEIRKMECQNW
jgi:hypothetical protein